MVNHRSGDTYLAKFNDADLCPVSAYRIRGQPTEIPEKNLWYAVLHRAMYDAIEGKVREYIFDIPVKKSAINWFHSQKFEPGTFQWIVSELGIERGGVEYILWRIKQPQILMGRDGWIGRTTKQLQELKNQLTR